MLRNYLKPIKCALLLSVLIVMLLSFSACSEQELTLSIDNDTLEVGDTATIQIKNSELTKEEMKNIQWNSSDGTILSVEDGIVTALYDDKLFNDGLDYMEAKGEDWTELDDTPENVTLVTVTARTGNYSGRVNVTVKPKPIEFENGDIVVEPKGSCAVPLEVDVTGNSYVYLKSTTNEDNDIAFLIKENGDENYETASVRVYVPSDTYELYYTSGEEWYGEKHKFGEVYPKYKDDELLDCTNGGLRISLYSFASYSMNSGSGNSIDESQFPGK